MSNAMTISRAAEQACVGVETIRFYERRGLIKQPARPRRGGYRVYDAELIERIHFIRQAQQLGFSLREIDELLALRSHPQTHCGDVRSQAEMKRDEVDHKIEQLVQIRTALDKLICACPGDGALSTCPIVDALARYE